MLNSQAEYERFIYSIVDKYASVTNSTLLFYSTSATAGLLKGHLLFKNGLELRVVEVIDFAANEILDYSYTIFRASKKVRWYDPQPHPDNPALTATFPHHYHEEPHIKQNRKPAPGISFLNPNLPSLIQQISEMA